MENGPPPGSGNPYDLRRLFTPKGMAAGAGIGVVLAGVAGAFAYTGGAFSPERLTQARVVDQFQRTNGVHPGFRRNHPKGVCFGGWFDSNGAGQRLSKAVVFQPGRTPIFGRFAIAAGQPFLPDTPVAVHSMALNFSLADGEDWRAGMNGIPIFTVGSVKDLYDQLVAATPDPKTHKPDPAKLKAYMATHPEVARASGIVKATPLASAFANTTYNSLNAFLFVDAAGKTTPVRWAMVPEDAFTPGKPDPTKKFPPNYQFVALAQRVVKGPVRWHLVVTVGQPGDKTSDATIAWPADRQKIDVGTLTVNSVQDEGHGPCRDITFDPLVLPAGIKGSNDPILSARSAAYAVSYTRRSGEPVTPSAVRFTTSNVESAHP